MRYQKQTPSEGPTQHNLNQIKIAQCRICLNIQSFGLVHSKLISPCKCTGSLEFVHENCMKQWINKIVQKSGKDVKSGKAHILCELCMSRIYFQTSTYYRCKSKPEMKEYFLQNIRTFVLLILLLLANLGFISALLNSIIFMQIVSFDGSNVVLASLMISGMVVFSIVAIVTAVALTLKFLLKQQVKYQNIGKRDINCKITQLTQTNEPKD